MSSSVLLDPDEDSISPSSILFLLSSVLLKVSVSSYRYGNHTEAPAFGHLGTHGLRKIGSE